MLLVDGDVPKDYKVYCFHGEPKYIAVFHDRFGEAPSQTIYDIDWVVQDCVFDFHFKKNHKDLEERPACYDELLEAARSLSRDFIHVRVDFYVVDGRLFFGELTFFNAGGNTKMLPQKREYELGSLIDLSRIDVEGLYTPL